MKQTLGWNKPKMWVANNIGGPTYSFLGRGCALHLGFYWPNSYVGRLGLILFESSNLHLQTSRIHKFLPWLHLYLDRLCDIIFDILQSPGKIPGLSGNFDMITEHQLIHHSFSDDLSVLNYAAHRGRDSMARKFNAHTVNLRAQDSYIWTQIPLSLLLLCPQERAGGRGDDGQF